MSIRVIATPLVAALVGFQLAFSAATLASNPGRTSGPGYDASVPEPTSSRIPYGEHPRHVLDIWKSPTPGPNPLVMVIHGGGWRGGSKERLHRFVDAQSLLDAGISVAAINYRLMRHAEDVQPPVKAPLLDAARALQFLRHNADEFGIDANRIGAAGGSAGACSSLWLAFHDDLADPTSSDPMLRQSTRPTCVAGLGAQTTLDPRQMVEWTPNSKYGAHAFGKESFAQFLTERQSILPWIAEYSPYALVSADDAPVCVFYNKPPAIGEPQKDPTHTANFGEMLKRRCDEVGATCRVVYDGANSKVMTDYLIEQLAGSN